MNYTENRNRAAADLIRWGPTLAGVLIAAAVFTMVNSAWLALAFSSADNGWRDALPWLVGGTAAVSLFLAGLFAGLFSGIRGIGAGLVNGATAWGLFFLISIAAVIPGAFNINARLRDSFAAIEDVGTSEVTRGLWTGFWSLLAGAVLALAGGAIGGVVRRPVRVSEVAGAGAGQGAGAGHAEVRSAEYPQGVQGRYPDAESRYPDASETPRSTGTPTDGSSRR